MAFDRPGQDEAPTPIPVLQGRPFPRGLQLPNQGVRSPCPMRGPAERYLPIKESVARAHPWAFATRGRKIAVFRQPPKGMSRARFPRQAALRVGSFRPKPGVLPRLQKRGSGALSDKPCQSWWSSSSVSLPSRSLRFRISPLRGFRARRVKKLSRVTSTAIS
jgi:hypothetical protein